MVTSLSPSDKAYEFLHRSIVNGVYRENYRLPSERNLTEQLGVGRSAVRQALERLENELLIYSSSPRIRMVAPRQASVETVSTVALFGDMKVLGGAGQVHSREIHPQRLLALMGALQEKSFDPLVMPDGKLKELSGTEANLSGLILTNSLFAPWHCKSTIEFIEKCHMPLCALPDSLSQEEIFDLPCPAIVQDHAYGIKLLVDYLIEQGCKQVFRIIPDVLLESNAFWIKELERGYVNACRINKVEALPTAGVAVYDDPYSVEKMNEDCEVLKELLSGILRKGNSPLGILASQDYAFFPIAKACRELGFIPGKDVLITGYDNYWEDLTEYRILEPAVPEATIDNEYHQLAEVAVDLLTPLCREGKPIFPSLHRIRPSIKIYK